MSKNRPKLITPKGTYLAALPHDMQDLLSDIAFTCSSKYTIRLGPGDTTLEIVSGNDNDLMDILIWFNLDFMNKEPVTLKTFVEKVIKGEETNTSIDKYTELYYHAGDFPDIIKLYTNSPTYPSTSLSLKLCQKLLDSLLAIGEFQQKLPK